MNEPLTIASQEKQVFYFTNPYKNRWSIIFQGKYICANDENQDSTLDIFKTHSLTTHVCTSYEENDSYDMHVIRYDH